jgi:OOP family OmpA-OmpF porin
MLFVGALPSITQANDYTGGYGVFALGISSYGNSANDESDLESELASQGIQANATVNDNPAGFTIGAGYRFNRYVALEANYVDLGTATASIDVISPAVFNVKEDIHATGETLDVLGSIPVSQRVSLFGKLGLFDYNIKETLSSNVAIPLQNLSTNGSTYDLGVGVEISFTDRLGLRAGLTQYHKVGDSSTGQQNLGLAYAQLVLNF